MYNNNILRYTGILFAAAFFICGCNMKASNKPVAKVNNEIITQEDLQSNIGRLPPYYRAIANQQKAKFLDEMINEKLFLKEAYRRGVDRSKDVKELLNEAKRKIILAKFVEDEIAKNTKISDKEIEEYYKLHKKEFVMPERYRASHILVSSEPEAKKVLERLQKRESFEAVAKEVSIDPSKANGGDLGYFTEGQMIPDFEAACFKLEIGQTSGILKTQFGYHIIKLTDKKPSQAKTLSEVSDQVRLRLMDMKKMEKLQDIVKELREKASITIYEK